MKSKNEIILNDEIDLREIILSLWKHKLLILIITLFFTVAGYIYSNFQPKAYQTTVTIQEAPDIVFKKYSNLFPTRQKINLQKIFKDYNKEFRYF